MNVEIEIEEHEFLVKKTNSYYYVTGIEIEAEINIIKLDHPSIESFEINITLSKAKNYDGIDITLFNKMIRSDLDIKDLLIEAYPNFL